MRTRLFGWTLAAALGVALLLGFTGLASQGLAWFQQQLAGVVSPSAAVANKCVQGTSVTYTSGPCPPGSRAQSLQGGTLSVMPAAPAAAASVARPPHARELLLGPEAPGQQSIKEQRMEAIIGR